MSPVAFRLPPLGATVSLRVLLAVLAGVWLLSVVPLALAPYPPLQDYPFHIARMYVLAHRDEVPVFQEAYELKSFLIPNVGMDLVVLGLSNVVSVQLAGRIFIALVFLGILGGCSFLSWSLVRRVTLWPLACAIFLYNWIFLYGFLNYLLGLAVMLWGVGAWIAMEESAPGRRVAVAVLFGLLLFFCHLSAFGVYAILISGYELDRRVRGQGLSPKAVARAAAVLVPALAPPLALFLLSSTAENADARIRWFFHAKPFALRTVFSADWYLDILIWPLLIGLAVSLKRRNVRIDPRAYLMLGLLAAAFILTPTELLTAWMADTRLIVAILFVLIAVSIPVSGPPAHRARFTAVLLGFVVYRCLILSYEWRGYARTLSELTDAYERLPAQSLLFSATTHRYPPSHLGRRKRWHPPMWHTANLAVLHADAVVPSMYADPGKQPLEVSGALAPLYAFQTTDPLSLEQHDLADVTRRIDALTAGPALADHAVFLLIVDPTDRVSRVIDGKRVFARGDRFMLVELRR